MITLKFIIVALASLVLLRLLSSYLSLYGKYKRAKRIGLPVIWIPVGYENILWRATRGRLVPLLRRLPFGLGKWVEFSKDSWLFRAKFHEQLGPAVVRVSSGHTQLILAEPKAAEEVFIRRKDFIKSPIMYGYFDMFGTNVLTSNGETWQRHRRITTPPFNERNSNLVWKVSLSQAGGMINSWAKKDKGGVLSTWYDTMSLALNVLMGAGFGKSHSFDEPNQNSDEGAKKGYRDTQRLILDNFFITVLTSSYWLPLQLLPSKWKKVKQATVNFKHQLGEMVEEERTSIQKKGVESDSLMSALLRSSEFQESNGAGRNSLSSEEIFGNLFIYNLAGHDTTANTLAYAVTLLSINPRTQEWLREEINSVLGSQEKTEKWEYEKAFPQLKRCLALMYEVLRLYPALTGPPRSVGSTPMPLSINGKEYVIPPNTIINVNLGNLQTDAKFWGPDPLTFRPQRWITTSNPSTTTNPSLPSPQLTPLQETLNAEQHITPAPGTYMPWTAGPRICPGKKFSQVEFVAVVASIFGKYRVFPVEEVGESEEDARVRTQRELENSGMKITLKMRRGDKVGLRWVEI